MILHRHIKTNLYKLLCFVVIISAFVGVSLFVFKPPTVKADELEELAKQIQDLENAKQQSEAATKPLEAEVTRLQTQLAGIQKSLKYIAANIIALEKSINEREADFEVQYQILANRVEDYYKQLRRPSDIFIIFSQGSLSNITKQLTYQKSVSEEDKNIISQISRDLIQLETDKQKVEKDKITLQQLQDTVADQSDFFQGEIEGARAYQSELDKKITELTVKQKELLAKKTETFQTSVGSVPQADDTASRPDYNPGFSPAFAAFSFGAPHFKGMSQYGAFGRAKSGQNVEDILKAYYGNSIEIKKDYSTDITIQVEGHGGFNIEEYVKRIYEMPSSWGDNGGMEALKAQAVAARSYALARTNSGSSAICATEACQVFKPQPKGGKWEEAVNTTQGWVLQAGGKPFSAWYASTSGGYQESYAYNGHSTPGFWDTQNGRDGWTSQAYEKIGESPWFYKGWYKTRSGITCGRSHPWLNQEEMSDIVNAVIVYTQDNNSQSHLSQEDSSCFGEQIPDTWDKNKLRQEAENKGGAVSSISSMSVTYGNNGITAQVLLNTNRGSLTFSGSDFYKIFNLRAPGAIHLKSGLFNIEKK